MSQNPQRFRVINFTLSNIQYVSVKLKRDIALDHREQLCVLRIDFWRTGPASWRTDADIKRCVPNYLFPWPKHVFYSPRVGLGEPALKCLLSNRWAEVKREQ